MNLFFSWLSGRKYREAEKTETWLRHTRTSVSELSLRRGQRVLSQHLFRKMREIHRRFSFFYAPYAKQSGWLESKGLGAAPPEALLLATRWLLKKHASVAAEFRSLETSLSRTSFNEIAPENLLEAGLLLERYVEQTAFHFSEETLATTLNDWQESAELHLSLAETEAISPLLRLLSLDKLSGVAIRLAEMEEARAKGKALFEKLGPDFSRYEKMLEQLRRDRGASYASAFAHTFTESLTREVGPFSRFRENKNAAAIPDTKNINIPKTKEAEWMRALSTRVRILLRSLSLLGEFEWNTLLKKTNTLHKLLIRDPAEVYVRMTSLSQEVYRKKAAALAKTLRLPEETLARTALTLAEEAKSSPRNHIGFYLVDDGLPLLLKKLTGNSHLSWWRWYHDRERLPALQKFYFICILVVSLAIAISFIVFSSRFQLLTFLVFPLIYKVAKHLVDSFFVGIVPPTFLPRINFRQRIPESVPAVFVIPALLKDKNTLHALLGKLETAYLSNAKSALSFVLLLDYRDADQETLPEDTALLEETYAAFRTLNDRYGETDRFAFFLRSRVWSARQEKWMGWERKRGKLLDFARILRGHSPSSPFLLSSSAVPQADFVITLDEDAFITRDFIKDMLGIHAHPLQKPFLNENGRLIHGFTFVQPHVKQWFKNRHRFRLPRIFFDEKRFSAYSSTFPEIYQDVFLEGSYAGKGSFHVESFLAALDKTLPTDQVLSHDLLEGSLARTAYAADIDAFDEFPKSLRAMLARNHRWTRGDWQIIDWLSGSVRDEAGDIRPNTLSGIHRFKIADNLLQSLFRPVVFLMTILSWIAGDSELLFFIWGLFLLDLLALDMSIDWARWIFQALAGPWKHLLFRFKRTATRSFRLFRQAVFECITLPYSAFDTLHAIGTAILRRFWSKKHMLEWIPSAHFENPAGREPLFFPVMVLLIVSLNLWFGWHIHPLFATLLALWTTIPFLVFALNRPYKHTYAFSRRERETLRQDALQTWYFFAETVSSETNFLPPDYLRSDPTPAIAEYTSITNIGFSLLSIIVAHRFGFISLKNTQERLEKTCGTLNRLERYQGHFYNWYHTKTALPAPPPFISSVDSGNLLASLITIRQWIAREMRPIGVPRTIEGLSSMAHFIETRIPRSLDAQSFADFWEAFVERIDALFSESAPDVFVEQCAAIAASLAGIVLPKSLPREARSLFLLFQERLTDAISEQRENISPLPELEKQLDSLITDMRFDFLKSNKRSLLSIGFHVPTKRLETRFYQTLASEARIANLLALAEGTLSFRGWNKLNRTVLALPAGPALISWTGTLFEYLMPAIFLEEHSDSLVGRSIRTAIDMNRRFSKKKRLPLWGLSESGYAELDRGGNFRYKPFGLASLSLSPSVDERPVMSAYGIVMSLSLFPRAALKNLAAYATYGGRGAYGYIESIDFHRSRHGSPVRMFMSHHQGMILSALGNCFFDRFLSRLFESHPLIQNSLFVLDEGLPPIDKEPFPRPAPSYLQSTLIHPRTP